jgi:hypothetical protein
MFGICIHNKPINFFLPNLSKKKNKNLNLIEDAHFDAQTTVKRVDMSLA